MGEKADNPAGQKPSPLQMIHLQNNIGERCLFLIYIFFKGEFSGGVLDLPANVDIYPGKWVMELGRWNPLRRGLSIKLTSMTTIPN